MGAIDELKMVPTKVKADEVKLARQVISNFEKEGDLTQYEDDYQRELRRVIDAKIAGEEIAAPADEAPPKVVNLMEALRQSLERVSANKKKPVKLAQTGTTGRVTASVAKHTPKKRARG